MTQYRAGQTVEVVTDGDWSAGFQNGSRIVLREMIPLDECFGGEWRADASNGSVGIIAEANFKPVSEGPVRTETVTTRRIVPGVYGPLHVSGRIDGKLHVSMGGMGMLGQAPLFTADELDAAARTLQQLAEALRDDS